MHNPGRKDYSDVLKDNLASSRVNNGLGKNGYLYIHYQNFDALGYIVGFNARLLLRGKKPYPVLVESEEFKRRFLSMRETVRLRTSVLEEDMHAGGGGWFIIEKYLEGKKSSHLPMGSRAMANIDLAVFKALENLEIKVGGLSSLTDNDKLYLLGHGVGGSDIIGSDGDKSLSINMKEYVQKLKKANLSKRIRDIRLISCGSGSHKSCIKIITNGPFSVTPPKGMGILPAQLLSEELAAAGYPDIQVSGYEGFSSIYPLPKTAPHFYKERFKELTSTYSIRSRTSLSNSESSAANSDLMITVDYQFSSASLKASSVKRAYINGREIGWLNKAFSARNIFMKL